MNRTKLLTLLAIALMVIQCGCSAKLGYHTGFLSDYSMLDRQSDVSVGFHKMGAEFVIHGRHKPWSHSVEDENRLKMRPELVAQISD